MFGGLIVDPADTNPVSCDREHLIILSDWSFTHPHKILRNLKSMDGYYNDQKENAVGLANGIGQSLNERVM